MIYLSTAIGLTAVGSSTVHIYTKTMHRTTQITTNLEECRPCPVFASFILAYALQLRKKHGKTSEHGKPSGHGKTSGHGKPSGHGKTSESEIQI